jgi:hypothetical protein
MPSVNSVNCSPTLRNTSVPARGSPLNPASSRERHVNGTTFQWHQRSSNLPQITPQSSHRTVASNSSAFGRPRTMSVRIAPLHVDFVIVGGGESFIECFKPTSVDSTLPLGISGLACAYALGRSGHSVCVLERARSLSQPSGGIRVPPNLTNILLEWGLGPDLARATAKCRGSTFHSCMCTITYYSLLTTQLNLELVETGEPIGHLEWREDVLKETGADFLLMHHGDLLRLFYKLCLSVGVTVNFNAAAITIRVNDDAEKIEVKTRNGRVYSADVLVGADGFGSIVREKVLGKRDYGVNSGMSVYT